MGIENFITKDGDSFYFDTESYEENQPKLAIEYQAGDIVRWKWEGKRMTGVLRNAGFEPGLFIIKNVKTSD